MSELSKADPERAAVAVPKEDPRERLNAHYEEIINSFGLLFERKSAPPPAQWPAMIEYRLSGGVAYYYNEGEIRVLSLEFPKSLDGIKDQVKAHLGPANWEKWEDIVRETNLHLEAVTRMWRQILEEFGSRVREIGLFPFEKLHERPLDIYWPSQFLTAIWEDIGYYEANKIHLWERVGVVDVFTPIPMRHTLDTVQTWVFSGLPWILTQSEEAAGQMKRAWEDEAVKVEPMVWELLEERSRIENKSREFLSSLHRMEVEYQGYHRGLPNSCEVCEELRKTLEGSARVSPSR